MILSRSEEYPRFNEKDRTVKSRMMYIYIYFRKKKKKDLSLLSITGLIENKFVVVVIVDFAR